LYGMRSRYCMGGGWDGDEARLGEDWGGDAMDGDYGTAGPAPLMKRGPTTASSAVGLITANRSWLTEMERPGRHWATASLNKPREEAGEC
jgi:hypothetical protein